MSAQLNLALGSVFAGDYRVERVLGQGGMGAVYVAHQLSTGRERALKLMHPNLVRDEALRRRFEQEARVGSRIKSEHIVQVLSAGVDAASGIPWLAMELLEGEDLERYVERRGRLSPAEVSEIVAQLCHALAAAHAAGVVHRDLKPENVFIARAHREGAPSTVKLLDLGIAKIVAEALPTQTAAVGSPLWMSPEQTGGKVGPQADVWALGLLVYWMLTGQSYWKSATARTAEHALMGVIREICVEPIAPASVRAGEAGVAQCLPDGFDAWFLRCVARDPADRFSEAGEARAALARVLMAGAATVPTSLQPAVAHALSSAPAEARTLPAPPTGPGATLPLAAISQSSPTTVAEHKNRWLVPALSGAVVALVAALLMARVGDAPDAATTASAASAPAAAAPVAPAPPPAGASAQAPPAPAAVERASLQVDHDDDKTIWNVPVGDSPQRGPADALVTIVEFGNFQCPFSKGVERQLRKILEEHPDTVRLVWKDDPLAIHSQAEAAAQLVREARAKKGEEGFWAAHDALIDPGFKPTLPALIDVAKSLKLDAVDVGKAIAERRHVEEISRDADLADDLVVYGTPYFFVNGRRVRATVDLDKLRAAIKQELERVQAELAQGKPRAGLYERLVANGRGALPLDTRSFTYGAATAPGRGSESPRVMLLQFCDFESFMCRLVDPTVDRLLQRFPELGVSWIDLPNSKSAESRRAAQAVRVAWREKGVDGFDKMRRLLLEGGRQPGGLSIHALQEYAAQIGFQKAAFRRSLEDLSLYGEIERDVEAAHKAGIDSAPAFLVCRDDLCAGGGYFLSGGHPERAFEKRIRLALDR